MAYTPNNPNGNTTAANSAPVTLASDNNGPVKIWDGTNTSNVIAGDTGYNGLAIASGTKTYTFSTTTTGAQTLLANTNTEGYNWIEVVLTSVGAGLAWTSQCSNTSGGTYSSINTGSWKTPGTNATGLGVIANTLYGTVLRGNYFQLAVSAMTSGTTAGYVILKSIPSFSDGAVLNAAQFGNWTVAGVGQINNGTITTSSSSIIGSAVVGYGGMSMISISGTYSGVSFGVTITDNNGTNYYNTPVYDSYAQQWLAPGAVITPGTNASKVYWVPNPMGNQNKIRVLSSAYTSGTATVQFDACSPGGNPGSTMAQLMDAAGNGRGANVDANNNLNVVTGTSISTGATPYSYISASGTNATNVKASAGTIYSLVSMNTTASARYIHMYNSASAPTAGSGTPIKRFLVPAGGGFIWPIPPQGVAFSSGIGFTITGGVADSDTTSISASDVVLNMDYI